MTAERAMCFELQDVVKILDPGFKLDISSLAFEEEKIHAVVGPNGSGKTTLLHILDLLEAADQGTIRFRGQRVWPSMPDADRVRRRLALVMQNPFLFAGTVFDDLAYGLRLRGLARPDISRRVSEYLARVGLTGFERRRTDELSGGEAKRVAIARAFALEADVLLLDEPTANVDRNHVQLVEQQVLGTHAERGDTIIVTTHDLDQARRLTSSIVCLVAGRVTSMPPDNVFRCEIVQNEDGAVAKLPGGPTIHVLSAERGQGYVAIHPSDILVSRGPIESSARNSFPARVVRATFDDGGVRLDMEAGVVFHVQITRTSYEKLGLRPGAMVFLTFKASSVQVL